MVSGLLVLCIGTVFAAILFYAIGRIQRVAPTAQGGEASTAPIVLMYRVVATAAYVLLLAIVFGLIPTARVIPIQFH